MSAPPAIAARAAAPASGAAVASGSISGASARHCASTSAKPTTTWNGEVLFAIMENLGSPSLCVTATAAWCLGF